jgi:hypothetical protein
MTIPSITVFNFARGSIITGGNVKSRRLATLEAIVREKCVPIPGTGRRIPASDLNGDGMTAIDYAG